MIQTPAGRGAALVAAVWPDLTKGTRMTSLICGMVLAGAAWLEAEAVTELRYSGTLTAVERGGDRTPVKQFDVTCLTYLAGPQQREVVHIVAEDSGEAVAWPERFGRQQLLSDSATWSGRPVQVLYVHQERPHLLTVHLPYLAEHGRLAEDAEFASGDNRYSVVRSVTLDNHPCWQVEMTPQTRGASSLLTVDAETGLIRSGTQRVTMGQGDLFELSWRLNSEQALEVDTGGKNLKAAALLLDLQLDLAREDAAASPSLTAEQLATAAERLEELTPAATGTRFEKLAAVISRDVQAQQQRAASVDELARKFVGQAAPAFRLTGLDEQPVAATRWEGKTLVLHFWGYRDDPLEEPYGQVGYLDYLMTRHGDDVVVIGVAVDPRFRDPAAAPQARRSVKKLKSFMNLGYEIATDATGEALKAFGDPTQYDAELPLWIVIGPNGKVAHYRTGFYEVDRDRGLADLDDAVSETTK